jgi:PAS domain S-box-containing protein
MPTSPDSSEPNESLSADSPLFCDLDTHRAMLQSIIDHSPADIYLKDLDGKYLLVNRNFGQRVGMDPALVIGKTAYHCFTRTEAEQRTTNDELVLKEGEARQFEEVVTMEDGVHTLLSEKFPVRDETGEINAVCGISTDITSRKSYEEKLRQLSSQIQQQGRTLETVLSASPNIVYMFDNQGRFLYANQSGAANFGVRPVDIIGKTWKMLNMPEGVFEPFMVHMRQVFKTGKTYRDHLSFPTPDGGQEFAYTLIPIMDIRGRVVNVIAYVNDITLDQEKDRILEKQNLELQRSNEELEEFARIASHDLNDPLRVVQQSLKQLREGLGEDIPDEAVEHLKNALDGAGRMKVLINDLLQYSQVGLEAEPARKIKMKELVALVERDMMLRLQESKAQLITGDLPIVWGDEGLLRQLLQQLISNGIQFNDDSNPRVEISFEQRNELFVFEVKDNGIGIEAGDFESVFQIFKRVHTRNGYSGTGVGLAICRKIVNQHGGDIWVRSMPGTGSSFFFSLPIRYKGSHQMTIDLFGESQ